MYCCIKRDCRKWVHGHNSDLDILKLSMSDQCWFLIKTIITIAVQAPVGRCPELFSLRTLRLQSKSDPRCFGLTAIRLVIKVGICVMF